MKAHVDHSQIPLMAAVGSWLGGFFMSAMHDPLVHQVIGSIVIGIAAALGTWFRAWWSARIRTQYPRAAAIADQAWADAKPLVEKYGHEMMVRIITRDAMSSPAVPPEALPALTGQHATLTRVPTSPGGKKGASS